MSPQKKYDYLFDKNTNPTWQAWSLCLMPMWLVFAGWVIWADLETIWNFWIWLWNLGNALARFFLIIISLSIILQFLNLFRIFSLFFLYFNFGISIGHFLGSQFFNLKGFKYFGLIFLTNLAQTSGIFYLVRIKFAGTENAQWYIPLIFALLPLIGAICLLIVRKYLQNQLRDLVKINDPSCLLDAHLLNNNSNN